MKALTEVLGVLRRSAADAYAAARLGIDTWLHPVRHRRAKARLRRTARPQRILVVCHGNVCRSPYMAAVLRQLLPNVEVSSGGFVGPGRSVPEHSVSIAARRGLSLSTHRSRLLTIEMIGQADLVVVMDARQANHITRALAVPAERVIIAGDLDPVAGAGRTIRDPWRKSRDEFVSAYARLDRCASVLADILRPQRAAPR